MHNQYKTFLDVKKVTNVWKTHKIKIKKSVVSNLPMQPGSGKAERLELMKSVRKLGDRSGPAQHCKNNYYKRLHIFMKQTSGTIWCI